MTTIVTHSWPKGCTAITAILPLDSRWADPPRRYRRLRNSFLWKLIVAPVPRRVWTGIRRPFGSSIPPRSYRAHCARLLSRYSVISAGWRQAEDEFSRERAKSIARYHQRDKFSSCDSPATVSRNSFSFSSSLILPLSLSSSLSSCSFTIFCFLRAGGYNT